MNNQNNKPTNAQIDRALKNQGDLPENMRTLSMAQSVKAVATEGRLNFCEDEEEAQQASEFVDGVVFCYCHGTTLISCYENGLDTEIEIRQRAPHQWQVVRRVFGATDDGDIIFGTYRSAKAAMTIVHLLRARSM